MIPTVTLSVRILAERTAKVLDGSASRWPVHGDSNLFPPNSDMNVKFGFRAV